MSVKVLGFGFWFVVGILHPQERMFHATGPGEDGGREEERPLAGLLEPTSR